MPIPTCINKMNIDVLQFIYSTDLSLQVFNLYLCSLKASDRGLVKIFLKLRYYLLSLFLEELTFIV